MKENIFKHICYMLFVMCLLSNTALAQNNAIGVTGTVMDETNQPLIGATVAVKGGSNATATDADGKFYIKVASGSTLTFTYIGYAPQERIVTRTTKEINIVLADDAKVMQDVVVIGYGKVQKKDLTGSIESLSSKDLQKAMVTNPAEALNGRVSGVLVSKSSNRPGAGMSIQIRGKNSFNFSNEPLYVIDGIPSYSGMRHISPDDIESIDVLKDASSCAIYGSRGANGVVIVTTKGASKREGFSLTYNGSIGLKTPTRMPDMLGSKGNGMEYVNFRIQQWRIKMGEASLSTEAFLTENERRHIKYSEYYDWLREFAKDGITTNHNISAVGGTKKTSYTFGVGYMEDEGMAGSENFRRLNGNMGIEYRAHDQLSMGMNTYLSSTNINYGSSDALLNAYYICPIVGRYEPDGTETFTHRPSGRVNPFIQDCNTKNVSEAWSFNVSAFLAYSPIESLKIKSQYAAQFDGGVNGYWTGTYSQYGMGVRKPYASRSEGLNKNFVWDNTITFDKTIADKHKLNFIGLYSMQKETHQGSGMTGEGLPYDSDWHQIQSADQVLNPYSNYWEARMASLMGRFNYVYDDRYLFTVTTRYDGTSRLAKGHRWGLMPSVALGWSLKNEDFMKDVEWIDTMKFRLSWGKSGNSNIGYNSTITNLELAPYDGVKGLGISNVLGNSKLRWEMTSEWNFGIDYGFFNNRIHGAIDVYSRVTKDLIMQRQIAHLNGFSSVWENIGSTGNRGVELSLNTVNISKPDFSWNSTLTFTLNRNRIIDLDGTKTDDLANRRFIGKPMDVYYDVKQAGIWQEWEKEEASTYNCAPGWPKIVDYDKNGAIDANDYHILGHASPDWTAGLTNTFTYKNWDMSVYMYTRMGGLYNDGFTFYFLGLNNQDWNKLHAEYWTPENKNNKYPGIGLDCLWTQVLAQVPGTFLKIQNITLGYSLKENLLKKLNMQGLRAYVSVQNPFTFSSYLGSDPEIIGENLSTQLSLYPMTFTFGVNVKF